jgi:hypothetical protein
VAVYLDKSIIAKDDINGWSFRGNTRTLVLNGDSCEKLKVGTGATVLVIFGCPGP